MEGARARPAVRWDSPPGRPPGPAEVKLSHYGDVRPLVVGSFAEMSEFVDELACAAATSGALKHWRDMRSQSPEVSRPLLLQRPRQSWGMAAARANGRLVLQRLQYVGDGVPVV